MKRIAPVTAGFAASVLVLTACSGGEPTPTESPRTFETLTELPAASGPLDELSWGYYANLPTLDPAGSMSREAGSVIGNLCDTLLRTEADLTVTDNLASIEMVDSTHYVLTLVEGATFWDSSPVTADDVVYSLNRHLDPAVGSDFGEYYANVAEITAADDRTVEIEMSAPDALFEAILGTMGGAVMQRAFSEAAGENLGSLQGDIMCSGPYTIASSGAESIVLERNESYWNSDLEPLAQRVTINYLQDGTIAAAALQSGEVQGMFNFPSVALDQLESSGVGAAYAGLSNMAFSFVVGGLEDSPLADVRLRQALSLAIDRTAIAERVWPNGGTAATSILGGSASQNVESTVELNATADLEAAQALVDEVLEEEGSIRPIKLFYTSGVGSEVGQLALYLQQVAEEIGLEIELDDRAPLEWVQGVLSATENPSFDLTFNYAGSYLNDPVAAFFRYLPTSSDNYSFYDNPSVTGMIADARAELDADARAELAAEIEAQVLEDLPMIPVVWVPRQVFVNDEVGGVVLSDASFLGFPWAATIGAK